MYEQERVNRQKRNRLCLGTYETSPSNGIAWISAAAGVSAITLFFSLAYSKSFDSLEEWVICKNW